MLLKPHSNKIPRRRRDKARKKRQARKIYPHDSHARLADHLKVCSCDMCGNPRRRFGQKSLQDIRGDQKAMADLKQFYSEAE